MLCRYVAGRVFQTVQRLWVESMLRMYEKQKGGQSGWNSEGENSRKWGPRDSGETHHGELVSFLRTNDVILYEMRNHREGFEKRRGMT